MGPRLIVSGDPGIEVGLQLGERPVDLLAERHAIELVERGFVEALADAIIRYEIFRRCLVPPLLKKTALW